MKIGILTSGGDTPGMNAVIRACYLSAKRLGHELIGIKYAWQGLMEGTIMEIGEEIVESIDLGGTILFSGRFNPYVHEGAIERLKDSIRRIGLDAVIAIGGEDTLGVANKLYKDGINVVGVPKTIDNDLGSTDYTFGFNTAYSIAAEAMDKIKTTAKSHERVLVVEIMGRHAGWMTIYAGIATGAHAILIPEHPISMEDLLKIIDRRYKNGNKWAVIAVSEGFGYSKDDDSLLQKDEFGHVLLEEKAIGKIIAELIHKRLGIPTRAITLGHVQRGGTPSPYDRVLCTRLGTHALELVNINDFGKMASLKGTSIETVPLEDAVANLKVVDDEHWELARKLMDLDSLSS